VSLLVDVFISNYNAFFFVHVSCAIIFVELWYHFNIIFKCSPPTTHTHPKSNVAIFICSCQRKLSEVIIVLSFFSNVRGFKLKLVDDYLDCRRWDIFVIVAFGLIPIH